ncbi:MAG: DUF6398 domain-containing protein [Solirubrobacteraceae bacterium]
MRDTDLDELKVPRPLRERTREILAITDQACTAHLDAEYAQLCRVVVARLSRKRPSPPVRGAARIWAAGAIYAIGQINFPFDRSQRPHLSTGQLADRLGVAKTTMAKQARADQQDARARRVGARADAHRGARAAPAGVARRLQRPSSSTPALCPLSCRTSRDGMA